MSVATKWDSKNTWRKKKLNAVYNEGVNVISFPNSTGSGKFHQAFIYKAKAQIQKLSLLHIWGFPFNEMFLGNTLEP